jgi:hypothetical protein
LKVQIPLKKKITIILLSVSLIFGILVLSFIIGIRITGFIPLSKTQQKEKVQEIFLDMGIDTCSIGNITFSLLNSISLHDVSLIKQIDNSRKMTCRFSEIEIQYYPITTLLKWNTCKKILQNKVNNILYKNSYQKKTGVFNSQKFEKELLRLIYDQISGPNSVLFSCFRAVRFNSDFIAIDSLDSQIIHFQNMSASINTEKNTPEKHVINLVIEGITLFEYSISSFHSTLNINGPECKTTFKGDSLFDGTLEGNFLFNLYENRIQKGKLTLDSINIEKVYSFYKYKDGSIDGACSIQIVFDSCTADFSLFSGTGSMHAIHVNARNLHILNQIAEITMLSGLSDLNFEEIYGDFTFGKGKIKSKNLSGKGDPISIDLSGWIKPDSASFSINLKGTFQPYYKDSISSFVWETLFPEEDGGRSFRCTIYGTQESPSISVDKNFATRAINNVIKTLGDELKSFFK